jgi:hypothetical protein
MLCLLFFPFLLPFILLRFAFRLVFGLLMLPFIMLFVAAVVVFAVASALFAVFIPLMPFALVILAIWALTRHSRAASAYPN